MRFCVELPEEEVSEEVLVFAAAAMDGAASAPAASAAAAPAWLKKARRLEPFAACGLKGTSDEASSGRLLLFLDTGTPLLSGRLELT